MIRELDAEASRYLSFIKNGLQTVETKFKKLGYFPFVSGITGGVEAFAGTAAAVMAFASAFFYKARLYIPRPFVSKETNCLWVASKGYNQSVQVLMDSVNVISMGVLKAIPGFSNVVSYNINTLVAQMRVAEKASSELKTRAESLQKQLDGSNEATKINELEQQVEVLSSNLLKIENPLREEIAAKTKKLEVQEENLTQLQSNIEKNKMKIMELEGQVTQVETKAKVEIGSFQEKLNVSQSALASAEASLAATKDELEQLKKENPALKKENPVLKTEHNNGSVRHKKHVRKNPSSRNVAQEVAQEVT